MSAVQYLTEDSSRVQKEAALMTMCNLGDTRVAFSVAQELDADLGPGAQALLVMMGLETGGGRPNGLPV